MTVDYSVTGQVSIDISHYVKKMVKELTQKNLKEASVASPWNEKFFKVQLNSAPLEKDQSKLFHKLTIYDNTCCCCCLPYTIGDDLLLWSTIHQTKG